MKNIHDELKIAHEKVYSEVEANYTSLIALLNQLDPIKLISQFALTYLTVPEGQFNDESADIHKWARWAEFLIGYLLAHNYPKNVKTDIDGEDLKHIEDLLKKYFDSITLYLISDRPNVDKDREINQVIHLAKNDSLYVRGESYPHQLRSIANDDYSQHDKWFRQNLGFTISDALSISRFIIDEYNRRINDEKQSCENQARDYVEELIRKGEAKEQERKDLEVRVGCYYYFGNSDAILSFTFDELIRFSGFSREICEGYLNRLSQEFGFRNPNHPDTFSDSRLAPWDYNTLYERPIILHDNKYFVPIPSLFNEVLLHTFYYDLIADDKYWKEEGERKYGAWLEQKTAEFMKRIFPQEEIFVNPKYPNGNELCDVLILHDRNIFILQCKTKRLRYDSKIGKELKLIRDDLDKAVKESFSQAIRARDYFMQNQPAKIIIKNGNLEVDSKQISDVFLLSVTLGSYPHLITRLANINSALNLFSNNQYPWAISLFDLGVVTELIESPAIFIHYARRRLAVERTKFDILADEIDMLGFYFSQGLYFKTEEFKKLNGLLLSGFSTKIDQYMFEKHELGENPKKPEQEMPQHFEEYIKTIERLRSPYKTDCAVRLLEFDYKGRQLFVDTAEKIKQQTKDDNVLHSLSTTMKEVSLGFSFVSMNAKGNIEELYRQVFSFAVTKKYITKCKEWVGLGWDSNSKQIIDVAVFLSFDWQEDPVIAQIAKDNLKPGEMIDIGT
ncbi:hypothetical protein ACFLXK_02540 [Chloroflexota bacterium]